MRRDWTKKAREQSESTRGRKRKTKSFQCRTGKIEWCEYQGFVLLQNRDLWTTQAKNERHSRINQAHERNIGTKGWSREEVSVITNERQRDHHLKKREWAIEQDLKSKRISKSKDYTGKND